MIGWNLLSAYDVLLVDLYGVIWSGKHAFPDALVALERLVADGKQVVILSNASLLSHELMMTYDGENLKKNTHFTEFVSSGNALRDILLNQRLSFSNNPRPKKYFVYGSTNSGLFANTPYEETKNLDSADFVYLSIARISDADRATMSDDMQQYLYLSRTHDGTRAWDSVSIEPFIPTLNLFLKMNNPIVVANPDKFAICSVLEHPDAGEYCVKSVVRQGLLAETYRKMGGEIFAIGKPFSQIYRYALQELSRAANTTLEDIGMQRLAMIGDSLETDILGAKNASRDIGCQIDSILVLSGITAESMRKNNVNEFSSDEIKHFCVEEGIAPNHVLAELSVGANVYY